MTDAQPSATSAHPGPVERSPEELIALLAQTGYLLDQGTATALYLALTLGKPLLVEGEPGVGKTSLAKGLAKALQTPLIRLQCYEGLTVAESLYEWNYQRQLLAIRLAEARHDRLADADLFTEEFLQERPVLQALRHPGPEPAVLLIDEIDRADDEFEAVLLEVLGEQSVTVPEIGTFTATVPPIITLTSNRSRELHDALRRRCLYHWIEFPDAARAAEIVRSRVPGASEPLITSISEFIGRARTLELDKPPGMAEVIDWVSALGALGVSELTDGRVPDAISALAKSPDDRVELLQALSTASA